MFLMFLKVFIVLLKFIMLLLVANVHRVVVDYWCSSCCQLLVFIMFLKVFIVFLFKFIMLLLIFIMFINKQLKYQYYCRCSLCCCQLSMSLCCWLPMFIMLFQVFIMFVYFFKYFHCCSFVIANGHCIIFSLCSYYYP